MRTNKTAPFDLHIQEVKGNYEIFSQSEKGSSFLQKAGVAPSKTKLKINQIDGTKSWPLEDISKIIDDRTGNEKFWSATSNSCFGCGACVAVCPLCFCTRQEFRNDLDGKTSQCLKWDACFAKRFSEIQNHHDLRPQNVDRLYNWYHHKFVRANYEKDRFLCTGCGRCIEACPANLNMKNIIETLIKLNSPKDEKR
jgi:ferredoxin